MLYLRMDFIIQLFMMYRFIKIIIYYYFNLINNLFLQIIIMIIHLYIKLYHNVNNINFKN